MSRLFAITCLFFAGCAGLTQNWQSKTPEQRAESDQAIAKKQLADLAAEVSFAPFSNTAQPPADPEKLRIMTSRPAEKYLELGSLELRARTANQTYEELTGALRARAASIGADGIVDFQMAEVKTGAAASGVTISNYDSAPTAVSYKYRRQVRGTAVKFQN